MPPFLTTFKKSLYWHPTPDLKTYSYKLITKQSAAEPAYFWDARETTQTGSHLNFEALPNQHLHVKPNTLDGLNQDAYHFNASVSSLLVLG